MSLFDEILHSNLNLLFANKEDFLMILLFPLLVSGKNYNGSDARIAVLRLPYPFNHKVLKVTLPYINVYEDFSLSRLTYLLPIFILLFSLLCVFWLLNVVKNDQYRAKMHYLITIYYGLCLITCTIDYYINVKTNHGDSIPNFIKTSSSFMRVLVTTYGFTIWYLVSNGYNLITNEIHLFEFILYIILTFRICWSSYCISDISVSPLQELIDWPISLLVLFLLLRTIKYNKRNFNEVFTYGEIENTYMYPNILMKKYLSLMAFITVFVYFITCYEIKAFWFARCSLYSMHFIFCSLLYNLFIKNYKKLTTTEILFKLDPNIAVDTIVDQYI